MSGKWKRHLAFVAVAEIGDGILGPLIGLGQKHAVGKALVDVLAQRFEELVRFGQVFAIRALSLEQIGNGVQPHAVDPHAEPEIDERQNGLPHGGIVVIQVGLVRIKPMPVVGFGDRVPGPVGRFEVLEDDAGFFVFLGVSLQT